MRAFIAIDIPEDIKKQIIQIQNSLPETICEVKKSTDFHITIQFIGEVEESFVSEIKEKLSTLLFKKFPVVINKIGFFPDKNYIRVIWLGLKNESETNSLQKRISDLFDFKQDRRFKPHITIGKIKTKCDNEKFAEEVSKIPVPEIKFNINTICLKESVRTPKGSIFKNLDVFKAKEF